MADKPSVLLMGTSAVVVAAGGVFIGVGAVEAGNVHRSIFRNSWFDAGFVLVILAIVFGVLIPWIVYFLAAKEEASPVSQVQSGGNRSTNIQAGRDINITRVSDPGE